MSPILSFNLLISLGIGFLIVYYIIPFIIKVARVKKLFDVPNERSATQKVVPTLGGVAILLGFFVSLILCSGKADIDDLKYLLAAVIVMFGVGLKDDLLGTSALRKLSVELAVAFGLVVLGNYRLTNLHGLLGIDQTGLLFGVILSVVAIVGIINAFNLIDGIDGLAAGTGILISLTYGTWFLLAGDLLYAIACFSLAGSLGAFFLYNVFGRVNKIFMGDTGSLIVGVIVAVFTIHFNEFVPSTETLREGLPAISLAIMIVPVIDTIRVFGIRIIQKKSPFSPDMNHIHHQLLRLGYSHLKSSIIIIASNGVMILIAFGLIDVIGNNILFLFIFLAGIFLANIPSEVLKCKEKKRQQNSGIEAKDELLLAEK